MAASETRAGFEGTNAIYDALGDSPVFEKPGQDDAVLEVVWTLPK